MIMLRAFRAFSRFLLIVCVLGAFPAAAAAAQFYGRDDLTIEKKVRDDLYIFGGSVTVEEDVRGDLTVVGGQVRVHANVSGDLFVLGGAVLVDGKVGDSARVAGGNIEVNNRIAKDLIVLGGNVTVGKEAVIGRDLFGAGGNLKVSSRVRDDINGSYGQLAISGPVGGNVKVSVGQLNLEDGARIRKNLEYRSENEVRISGRAKVEGQTKKYAPLKPKSSPVARFFGWLMSFLSMLVVGLIAAAVFPKPLRRTEEALAGRAWPSLGIGFAVLFLTPIVLVLLLVTVIGIPLALILTAGYLVSIYTAQIFTAAVVGETALARAGSGAHRPEAGVAVGVAALSLVKLVPVIGPLATFFAMMFGLGAISLALWQWRRGPVIDA